MNTFINEEEKLKHPFYQPDGIKAVFWKEN
jgi:hypothetical protein